MAFKEVGQLSTEKEYEIITQHFKDLKQHIQDCFEYEDFEALSSYDMTKLKELYFTKSMLFWKMKQDTVEARMAEIKKQDKFHYQHNIEFCELMIKKFTYYGEKKQAELKAQGDFYSFNKHHKPGIDNQIMHWKMRLENCKKLRKMDTSPRRIEVIP